jgi:GT2 family glycosyltransferase
VAGLPFVSVITINWNGERYLQKLFSALEAQTYPRDRFEIIMVDNNTTRDNSVAFVKEHFPDVVLIENPRNDGFAKGCNIGFLAAKGTYLVLLNNDSEPDKNWLRALVNCAETHEHVGAVASKMMFANKPGVINNAGSVILPDRTWPVDELGANQEDGPEFSKVREISAFCGGAVLLSRAMLRDVGMFDETYFMYFEDTDLSWRGQKAGWKYYFEPTSIMYHEHSGSTVEHSPFWTFSITRNHMLIMFKQARIYLAGRVLAKFIRDFFVRPILNGVQGRDKRLNLEKLRLGFKIGGSFLIRIWPILLKRFGLLAERKLS